MIVGTTESGKTTYAKLLVAEYHRRGINSVVLDPMLDTWGDAVVFDDIIKFRNYVLTNKNLMVFVDESGDTLDPYDKTLHFLATKGRHWGHSCHFIGQRLIQIPATMRAQTGKMIVFTTTRISDCKELANEYGRKEIEYTNLLPKFHFVSCNRYGYNHCGKVDPLTKRIYIYEGDIKKYIIIDGDNSRWLFGSGGKSRNGENSGRNDISIRQRGSDDATR